MNFFYYGIIANILFLSSCSSTKPSPLPKLGNYDLVYYNKNGIQYIDTVYPKIPTFNYLNEDSIWVSNENFKNKIWIVEFFFANCPTICPLMNQQLKKLVAETSPMKSHLQFLSFTIDPINDSPSKLRAFKIRHGIKSKNWAFLTGDEAKTHVLGIKNFLTFAGKDADSAGGYAHSGSFSLVDKEGYVRGVYAVTNFDLTINQSEYDRLKKDIINLIKYK